MASPINEALLKIYIVMGSAVEAFERLDRAGAELRRVTKSIPEFDGMQDGFEEAFQAIAEAAENMDILRDRMEVEILGSMK